MQATTNATEPFGLATITEAGEVPKERIASADRCRELAEKLIRNDQKRNLFDTRVKGMRDGNRPYKDSVLRKHAQSWRTNVNWMEGKAMISGAMVPYYDLLSGSPHYCGVTLRGTDQFLTSQHSKTVTELFDELLKNEACFEHELMLAMHDRLTYGRGLVVWEDEFTPFFKWVNRFCVHVPDRTRSIVDDLKVLVIEKDFEVDELYESYTKAGAAERGWDKKACAEAISRAESPSAQHSENRLDLEQQRAADKDILDGMSHNAVRAAHVYVKEFSGKVSHYIVERSVPRQDGITTDQVKKPHGYLFKKTERWDNWANALWASFHEITDGSWNGASGMGKDILPQIEIKNRVKCSTVDLGFMRSAINLRATTDSAYGKVGIIQHGPVNVFPPGYEPMSVATYVGDIDAMMALDMNIEQTIGRNTGIYRQLPEKANGNPLSATGEILRNQQSATLTNSAVTRFYSDLDKLFSEMFRRAIEGPDAAHSEPVKRFRNACEEAGIPIEELRNFKHVRAYRTAGNGSVVGRQQSLAQLAALSPLFPPKGQQEWVRDSISGLTNVETADRYFPVEPGDEVTLDHQIAMLENDSLAHGAPVMFAPNQNHVIHAQVHLQTAAQALQSAEQGGDPIQILASLEGLMPHADQHIAMLEGNPSRKNEATILRGQWKQIAAISDKMREQVQQMQAEQAEAQAKQAEAQAWQNNMTPEQQLDFAKAAHEQKMVEARTRFTLESKAAREAQSLKQTQEKHAQEMAINDARTAAEIQREAARTIAELNQNKAKAASDAAAKAKKD